MSGPFPSLSTRVDATWVPLLLRPIVDAPERLVIGVAAFSSDDHYLATANALSKLKCLLEERYFDIDHVARLGLKSFEKQLGQYGSSILENYRAPTNGILIGEPKKAAGVSLKEISSFWLAATSSLHRIQATIDVELEIPQLVGALKKSTAPQSEVVQHILAAEPELARNFRASFARGRRVPAHQNEVDYKSDAIVANIDFISSKFTAPTVNRIVKRMWDLEIYRGVNDNTPHDAFEMLVEVPYYDDMDRAERQKLAETVQHLTWQADQREIRFRPLNSTEAISRTILDAELVAA